MKKIVVMLILAIWAAPMFAAGGVVVVKPRAQKVTVIKTKPLGMVDINCNRDLARVYVNGKYVGPADDFDGYPGKLRLPAGKHTIRI